MEITSRQGEEEVTAELSKKQGSASNGEKQTSYFIILAASLLQCYPRRNCCARLAFIDEAFSALSRERIEQMVKYLEKNDSQVIYAAPPEKISSIGQWQKKVYESMVLRLDAAIDKVEDLSRDVELDRMEKKQADKPEHVTDIREEITPVMSVAEPQSTSMERKRLRRFIRRWMLKSNLI